MKIVVFLCLALLLTGCSGTNAPAAANKTVSNPSVSINKTDYFPGEDILVTFVASADYDETAWIGIFPSGTDFGPKSIDGGADLVTHQTLQKKPRGVHKFQAPTQPGGYTIRMYDSGSNGKEVNLTSFNVDAGQYPALGLSEEQYKPGAEIEVRYFIPEPYRESTSVALVPANADEEQFKNAPPHKGTEGKALGTLIFRAPEKPGNYEIRLKWAGEANGGQSSGVTPVSFAVK